MLQGLLSTPTPRRKKSNQKSITLTLPRMTPLPKTASCESGSLEKRSASHLTRPETVEGLRLPGLKPELQPCLGEGGQGRRSNQIRLDEYFFKTWDHHGSSFAFLSSDLPFRSFFSTRCSHGNIDTTLVVPRIGGAPRWAFSIPCWVSSILKSALAEQGIRQGSRQ